ncbi:hypothetical protein BIW11_10928 [Tropilaelaps mercedesae]|uniref:Uncharacterized protein n=1 Tax=Tropilaelaps mercedesae TaxID=418985 RepID=A0A1V9XDM9_9ACAR|nr:hypothetical protein BIW11_10928 [Tropilaelaps mercedesae]
MEARSNKLSQWDPVERDEYKEILLDFVEKDVGSVRSRRAVVRGLFMLLWPPLFVLTTFVSLALYQAEVSRWILDHLAIANASFIAMPLLHLLLICCPRVKTSTTLTLLVLAVFILDFAYVEAALSVIYETYCAFMTNLICLLTCTQIVVLSMTRLDLTTPLGVLIVFSGHFINYVAVASAATASIVDKVITGGAVLFSAIVMIFKVRAIIIDLVPEHFI